MKKVLLSVAALCFATASQAQLLNYGFEDDQTAVIDTANWAKDFPDSEYDLKSNDAAKEGTYGLQVNAVGNASGAWQRVVAFKQLGLGENKSYRVSFDAKAANGKMNVALLQGDWDCDIALQAGNGENRVSQTSDVNTTGAWARYTRMFWAPSNAVMDSIYKVENHANPKGEGDFLRLSFLNEGLYFVDNIKVEEATIAGATFNQYAIRIDLGYATNVAELANANNGTLMLEPSCASVTVDGEEAEVETVELKSDGFLYVFLTSMLEDNSKVTVSFTNPGDLKYASNVAPFCWDNLNAAVCNFENETAYFDATLEAESFLYSEAELVSSNPADESFELDYDIKTFTFTFDKPMDKNEGKATLVGTGVNEVLVLMSEEGDENTLVFARPNGAANLAKGLFEVILEDVTTEKGTPSGAAIKISFETGKVTLSETTYTLVADCTFPDAAANGIPAGWTVLSDGETRTSDNTYSSGGRTFDCAAPQKKGIYTRANGGDASVLSPLTTIPAGDVELRVLVAGWSSNSNVTLQMLTAEDVVVLEKTFSTEAAAEGIRNNADFQFPVAKFRFTHDGSDLKMYIKCNSTGFSGIFVGGFEVYTYEETEGEKSDEQVLFEETFANVSANHSPAKGSGWRIYRDGVARSAGASFNWGEQPAGESGGGPRIFDLAYKGLTKGFYSGGGSNNSIVYGEGLTYTDDEGVEQTEPLLELPAGKINLTYNATLWKAEGVKLTVELFRKEDFGKEGAKPVVAYTDVIETKSPAGNANDASVESQKFEHKFSLETAGNYVLRAYPDGEAFVGMFKMVKPGSLAVEYKNRLKAALVDAIAELETANSDDNYAGDTRDALAKAIEDCTEPDFHTVKEYENAIAELGVLVKKMILRRENVNTYDGTIAKAVELAAELAGTKYERLECAKTLADVCEKYGAFKAVELNDDDLNAAAAVLKNGYAIVISYRDEIVNLLIKQAVDLSALALKYNPALESNYIVAAADMDGISDDQELVSLLKMAATIAIYDSICNGLAFEKTEEVFDEITETTETVTLKDSIDMTPFIQNAGFYTTAIKQKSGAIANANSFPGWTIDIRQNSILADWGWGGPYKASETCPISDAACCTAWGTSDIEASQKVVGLPVGIFTASIKVGDGTAKTDDNLSRAYYKTEEKSDSAEVINDGGARNADKYEFTGIAADINENQASLTIGAVLRCRGDFAKCDDAAAFMTNKVEGFDYAAASAALKEIYGTGIKTTERTDAPAQQTYYNLNGQRINAAEGVCIRIDRYADGYTVVRKVVVK